MCISNTNGLIATWSRRKFQLFVPRSYNPTPPSRNVQTTWDGGRAKLDVFRNAGGKASLVDDRATEGVELSTVGARGVFVITLRVWKPVFFTVMFSIGVALETFHTRMTPAWESNTTKKISTSSHTKLWACTYVVLSSHIHMLTWMLLNQFNIHVNRYFFENNYNTVA